MKLFGREVGARADDPDDTLDTDVDDLDADTPDDPLADFDDDARQTIEQVMAQKLAAQQQTYFEQARQQAQARGFDYAADGSLVLANPAVAQQWVGTPTPTAVATPSPVPDAQDTPPDPTLYPEQYNAWIERQIEKRVTAERQSYQNELGSFKQLLAQQAVGSATQRATATLERLGQGQIAQHPMFHEAFSALLLQNPQEKWGDDMNLARWAMLLAPDLLAAQPLPPPTVTRMATPAANPAAIAGNYASRVGAPGFQPSRETARAPKATAYSEEDTFHASQLGLPVEEVIALRDPSGVAYQKYKAAKRSKTRQ